MSERIFKPLEGELPALSFIRAKKLADDGITGVVLEGEYLGEVPNKFDEEKNDFKFKKDDGSMVIVNSCGSINHQMAKVKVGEYVQISYLGQKTIKDGKLKGKKIHDFKILKA